MKTDGILRDPVNERPIDEVEVHDVRDASALSGALVGMTAGLLGGIAGVGAAGVFGAMMGALGGLVLERQLRLTGANEDDEMAKAAALIEPPCADCVDVRAASAGTTAWCARHTKHHPAGHVHYAYPASFEVGSMLFHPTV